MERRIQSRIRRRKEKEIRKPKGKQTPTLKDLLTGWGIRMPMETLKGWDFQKPMEKRILTRTERQMDWRWERRMGTRMETGILLRYRS